MIAWHYDHTSGNTIKGIHFITALYHVDTVSLPVNYQLVHKTEVYIDKKSVKEKRRSPVSKNERYGELLRQIKHNQIPFRYVLNDVWFASADNMVLVKHELEVDFVMPLKTNRKVALSLEDKKSGHYERIDALGIEADSLPTIYLEGVDFPLHLVKQVFTNWDVSIGILYLVTSDLNLSYDDLTTIYGKRWNVVPYHKSLKQNAFLSKSPIKTITTQTNPMSDIKLELLKITTKTNHFAFKAKLYMNALQSHTLHTLQPIRFVA